MTKNKETKSAKAVKQAPVSKKKEVALLDSPVSNIAPFVSNLDGDTYAIYGIPEEFVATLFAWVSRSDKSFRVHLAEAIEEFGIEPASVDFKGLNEKAQAFHEKWTVGYGHASVSEHAFVHIGMEKVSRKLTADLELASDFLSVTEYSQRYQKPIMGGWHNPFTIGTKERKAYDDVHIEVFKSFEKIIDLIHKDLIEEHEQLISETCSKQDKNRLLKLAFEDARYILPVSMHSQLGITANARAWKDVVSTLGTSTLPEYITKTEELEKEISEVTPVLLRHTKPSSYQQKTADLWETVADSSFLKQADTSIGNRRVKNIGATITSPLRSEEDLIKSLLMQFYSNYKGLSFNQFHSASISNPFLSKHLEEDSVKMFNALLEGLDTYDHLHGIFKTISFSFEAQLSEANWHQLLRHNRSASFTRGNFYGFDSYLTPKTILANKEANALFEQSIESLKALHVTIRGEEKEYLYTNAHMRPVSFTASIWSLYHLINLRTTDEAQWEIRDLFNHIHQLLLKYYPKIFSNAKRR